MSAALTAGKSVIETEDFILNGCTSSSGPATNRGRRDWFPVRRGWNTRDARLLGWRAPLGAWRCDRSRDHAGVHAFWQFGIERIIVPTPRANRVLQRVREKVGFERIGDERSTGLIAVITAASNAMP